MGNVARFPSKPCTDHRGVPYASITEMCDHWGINPETYTRRIKVYHMSVEDALTKPVKPNGGQICRDHQGTRYKSRTMMCKKWNGISTENCSNTASHMAGTSKMP